ncbi:MAG: hypothetical protein ACR2LS_03960, partial [Thermomicrobiales bacterium]
AIVVVLLVATTAVTAGGGPASSPPDEAPVLVASTFPAASTATATTPATEIVPATPTERTIAAVPAETSGTPPPTTTEANAAAGIAGPPAPTTRSSTPAEDGLLPQYRILSYYGHPASDQMGILGEFPPEEVLAKLREQAAAYEAADPDRPVLLALEVIATVAQPEPQYDGTYLLDTTPSVIQEYIDFAEENGIQIILDVQIGKRGVEGEVERLIELGLLDSPFVHLALDPEFAIGDDETPGIHYGSIDGAEVTWTQQRLAAFTAERGLPPKVLIVHQFVHQMLTNKDVIQPVPGVQLVFVADGHGPPELKEEVYTVLIRKEEIQYNGIKLFYKDPNEDPLMTPEQVLALDPVPDVVIYQ